MIPEQVLKYAGLFLKLFHDGKKSTNFPPLLINNKLESDFKTKANYFNSFFASKFTPLVNSSNTPPRPLLLNCLFNVTEILKIVMQDMAIIYYLLFSRKNNKCSCTLLKINYCDVSRMYLSLGTNKCIYYWCSCHWTFLNNIHYILKSHLSTLLKNLMETNTLKYSCDSCEIYHFGKILLVYGAQKTQKQLLSPLQCKPCVVGRSSNKKLTFSIFLFRRKVL